MFRRNDLDLGDFIRKGYLVVHHKCFLETIGLLIGKKIISKKWLDLHGLTQYKHIDVKYMMR